MAGPPGAHQTRSSNVSRAYRVLPYESQVWAELYVVIQLPVIASYLEAFCSHQHPGRLLIFEDEVTGVHQQIPVGVDSNSR